MMDAISDYLASENFTLSPNSDAQYVGAMRIAKHVVYVKLQFFDGPYDYPAAFLVDWAHDDNLRNLLGPAHVRDGVLCYIDSSLAWWDSVNADRMTATALMKIRKLLEDKLNKEDPRWTHAIARDFWGYWGGISDSKIYAMDLPQGNTYFETDSKNQKIISKSSGPNSASWYSVKLPKEPHIPEDMKSCNPTIKTVFNWLASISPDLPMKALSGIQKIKSSPLHRQLILTWPRDPSESQIGVALSFPANNQINAALKAQRNKSALQLLKQTPHGTKPVTLFELIRADAKFICERSSREVSPLPGKKIILIGAGTIGGHLAKLLCSAGAGTKSGGSLKIIDKDNMGVENIGRHILGFDSVGQNKSEAITRMLCQQFPHANITHSAKSILSQLNTLPEKSIIIDATGCETISCTLPHFLQQKQRDPMLFHSWVHGHGGAVLSFYNDREGNGACFRCLSKIQNDRLLARYELSKPGAEQAPVQLGCHNSFHPYPGSVSQKAALLNFEHIINTLNGTSRHTLQIQVLDTEQCQNRPSTTPTRLCSLCVK